ncbi:MAG: site-specific integrase [Methanotrichaceae archaeon]|nr:site-specific integrase [Methanotrichaceae archaeon]
MIDCPVKLQFLKLNNALPYHFDERDSLKIFGACNNLKHHCMLKVLFFGCLRSGELCNLDVPDYDPKGLTLRLRETKNNYDAIAYINDETDRLLNQYLQRNRILSLMAGSHFSLATLAIGGLIQGFIRCSCITRRKPESSVEVQFTALVGIPAPR